MTNQERQKSLEKKRKREQLGIMPYCNYCDKRITLVDALSCWASQEERTNDYLCAKAYNRMIRQNAEQATWHLNSNKYEET